MGLWHQAGLSGASRVAAAVYGAAGRGRAGDIERTLLCLGAPASTVVAQGGGGNETTWTLIPLGDYR